MSNTHMIHNTVAAQVIVWPHSILLPVNARMCVDVIIENEWRGCVNQ